MPVPERRGLVARSLLRDDAYRALRNAIVDGTLAPGERLNDGELVSWLGVSRTPIREALARLEQSGLVQTRPGRFTIVSPVDLRETRAAQSVVAAMHELAVRAVLEQYGPVLRRVERLRFSSLTGRASVAQHEKIIQLCAAGDADGASAAARANWQTLAPLLEVAAATDA
jgi:DNA-binding GntR family transcriptional regulator